MKGAKKFGDLNNINQSLILAQDERWRRASNMQVERSNWRNKAYLINPHKKEEFKPREE